MKNIYLIYTGGTIGMQKTEQGYQPVPGFLGQHIAKMPAFQHSEMPKITLKEYQPLLDSSNMTPTQWQMVGQDILDNYQKYDGFVVLHGTDTMAYTASALSFMLENLSKPVILTGSQIPLIEIRNDARDNLINSLLIASHYAIPEVCIYFAGKLFRGNRARKMNAQSYDAFESPNFQPLATVATDINVRTDLLLPTPRIPLQLQPIKNDAIAVIELFIGMSIELLEQILTPSLQALVLKTFGAGNAPDNNPELLNILKKAIDRGCIIVNCSQCPYGRVEMQRYATGGALSQIGVISGFDMTPETVITKLMYLFSKNLEINEIKRLMQTNLRGELSTSL